MKSLEVRRPASHFSSGRGAGDGEVSESFRRGGEYSFPHHDLDFSENGQSSLTS